MVCNISEPDRRTREKKPESFCIDIIHLNQYVVISKCPGGCDEITTGTRKKLGEAQTRKCEAEGATMALEALNENALDFEKDCLPLRATITFPGCYFLNESMFPGIIR